MNSCVNTELQKYGSWSTKQRRAYHRIKSDVRMAELRGKTVRFLTLSTSETKYLNVNARSLNDDFRVLKGRIKRLTVNRLIKNGYVTEKQASHKYGSLNLLTVTSYDLGNILEEAPAYSPFSFNKKVMENRDNAVKKIIDLIFL